MAKGRTASGRIKKGYRLSSGGRVVKAKAKKRPAKRKATKRRRR
ncbi:MAG: hypothetical protein ACFCUQ_10125 [Kiloniellales bacterium]